MNHGVYTVAFGDPARVCATRLIKSIRKHMPDVPVCLCAAKSLGLEDRLVIQPDSDIGGRRAKLKAYELSPQEWDAVLYLDADTEVVAPVYRFFEWIEDGWELVICKDVDHNGDTMHAYQRKNNAQDIAAIQAQLGTLHVLQFNGGVLAFGRNARVQRFFQRWEKEWATYAQRDQGALIRALYANPLRTWVLGSEWNTFPKYNRDIVTAGILHYPSEARRWEGQVRGRIDGSEAWQAVTAFEQRRKGR